MNGNDADPPVADDDFPEFAEPPRHRPAPESQKPAEEPENGQGQVDDLIARLRQERGKDKN